MRGDDVHECPAKVGKSIVGKQVGKSHARVAYDIFWHSVRKMRFNDIRVHSALLVRDDSATYFLFELLFVTRFLIDFIKGFATEQSTIDRVCSLRIIGSRR